jgi:hypothetical protein
LLKTLLFYQCWPTQGKAMITINDTSMTNLWKKNNKSHDGGCKKSKFMQMFRINCLCICFTILSLSGCSTRVDSPIIERKEGLYYRMDGVRAVDEVMRHTAITSPKLHQPSLDKGWLASYLMTISSG